MHILAFCNHLLVLPQFEFLHEKGFCILLLESVIQHNWCHSATTGFLRLGPIVAETLPSPVFGFLLFMKERTFALRSSALFSYPLFVCRCK